MERRSFTSCPLCEAHCGIAVDHDERRVLAIRGDSEDPLSRGYVCPKAAALADLHHDPDRLRRPLARVGPDRWQELSWDEALDRVAERLSTIRQEHGRDAVGVYVGNPTVHSHSALLYGLPWIAALRTRQVFSSNSVDGLPRLLTSFLMYGAQSILPVPDIDRTRHMIIIGGNPVVSNGSFVCAPGFKRRLRALGQRGGRLVVIDPRRTETAELADQHVFIRPGSDAYLLAAMLHVIFAQGLARPGRLTALLGPDGALDRLAGLVGRFPPERAASLTGIECATIVQLARDFAAAPSAVCYGRLGTCTQRFGAVTSWLIDCLNIATGNFDRPGGAMFATPAADLSRLAALMGQSGHFDHWRSRVSGLPEFNGELPATALAEEITTPGRGQIRALITHAGNPVLSLPGSAELDRALGQLDFMVSIDIYRNETTRHADIILPPTFGLERDHYPLIFAGLSVRNTAKFSRAIFARAEDARHDWEIFAELGARLLGRGGRLGHLAGAALRRITGAGPDTLLALALRLGSHDVSLAELARTPHGRDLGPLEPRLPHILDNAARPLRSVLQRQLPGGAALGRRGQRRIELLPAPLVGELDRLDAEAAREAP
ncbi:MAG: molybdopterin-dependent oxidoreductase, partial [Myxococcota bacterium]